MDIKVSLTDFTVTPDVLTLVPNRVLVETALELVEKDGELRICDVGTGSGCIAISILYERPRASGIALDISPAALNVAATNAQRHAVDSRQAYRSDCFASLDRWETVPTYRLKPTLCC